MFLEIKSDDREIDSDIARISRRNVSLKIARLERIAPAVEANIVDLSVINFFVDGREVSFETFIEAARAEVKKQNAKYWENRKTVLVPTGVAGFRKPKTIRIK